MSNDSLKAMLTAVWNGSKNVSIKMRDWESVIAKDKTQEWVTLWYTQYSDNAKGVKDSVAVIDDIQIKNGKISQLDEYTRKFH